MQIRPTISIVSHGHQSLIQDGGLVSSLHGFDIILRENVPKAKRLVPADGVRMYVQKLRCAGFGANHNHNFEINSANEDDWFIICNPDIMVDGHQLMTLLSLADQDGASIAAPALWNERENRFDDNVRPFPTFVSLLLSFAGFPAQSRYSDEDLLQLKHPDWVSGAFIAFKAGLYRQLGGFDERFFMYMEDVDICRRAKALGFPVYFYPSVTFVHNAARENRRMLSKNFLYHIASISKYFLIKKRRQ